MLNSNQISNFISSQSPLIEAAGRSMEVLETIGTEPARGLMSQLAAHIDGLKGQVERLQGFRVDRVASQSSEREDARSYRDLLRGIAGAVRLTAPELLPQLPATDGPGNLSLEFLGQQFSTVLEKAGPAWAAQATLVREGRGRLVASRRKRVVLATDGGAGVDARRARLRLERSCIDAELLVLEHCNLDSEAFSALRPPRTVKREAPKAVPMPATPAPAIP